MARESSVTVDIDAFAGFLRTTVLPERLLSPDVFCDMNVPMWRFQLQGAEALASWAKDESPNGSEVTLGRVRDDGTSAVVETVMVTDGTYSRNLWLLRADPEGLIDEVVLYCTGPWDEDTVARQAREAPMIRR